MEVKQRKPEAMKKFSRLLRPDSLVEPIIMNPFENQIKLPWYEWIKVGIMSVTIAPIRVVLIIILLALASILSYIACIKSTRETFIGTLSYWRKCLRYGVRILMRLVFVVIGFFWIEIKGKRANPRDAMILTAAPHTTFLDVIIFMQGRTLSGTSKAENADIPFLSSLSKLSQPVWVKRDDIVSRNRTIELLTERSTYAWKMPQLAVFPEGTTTNGKCLINFKAGAFIPGAPVQPVLVTFPNRINCTPWVTEGLSVLALSWLTLCQFYSRVKIDFLPVYNPSPEEKSNAKLYANNVRNLMAASLNIPTTDHSYDDVRLMTLAKKHKLPQAAGIVEFSKMSRKLTINFSNMSEFINYFADMSREMEGKITVEAFSEYLGLPVSPEVQRLFNMYDRSRSGYIDFREYVIGLCLVTMPANTEESLKMAFTMIDPEKKGEVSDTEFIEVMGNAFSMEEKACRKLFTEMDVSKTGMINYDDFIQFSKTKPEFVKVVSMYQDFINDAKYVGNVNEISRQPRKEKLL